MNSNRLRRHGTTAFFSLSLGIVLLWLPAEGATPQAYDSALAQVQNALARQTQAVQHGIVMVASQSAYEVATRVLTPINSVESTGQASQPVDASLLLASIRTAGTTGTVKQRVASLHAVIMQVAVLRQDMTVPRASGAPADAEAAARAVLSARIYDYEPLPPPSLLDRFSGWLERMLNRMFRRHASPSIPHVGLGFVKGIVIILLTGAFALLVAVLVQWLRRRTALPQPLALDETEAALVEARDTDSLKALAEQKARLGDYRLALRFVYLALLVTLDTNGVLRFDRSKTNWEYLRSLRASGRADVYDAMTPLTREFDRIWYGFANADASDYARALTQYDALQAASKSPPVSRPTAAV